MAGAMVKRGNQAREFRQAGIPADLADEVMLVLRQHPWLGKGSLSDVATRSLQTWLSDAYTQIVQRERLLEHREATDYPGEGLPEAERED